MSTCATPISEANPVPVREIRDASNFGVALHQVCVLRSWQRKVMAFYYLPRILKFITTHLPGGVLGELSREQAESLYEPLCRLHSTLIDLIDSRSSRSRFERIALRSWFNQIEVEVEKIADVLETLAWATDEGLKAYIDAAVASIEHRSGSVADCPPV